MFDSTNRKQSNLVYYSALFSFLGINVMYIYKDNLLVLIPSLLVTCTVVFIILKRYFKVTEKDNIKMNVRETGKIIKTIEQNKEMLGRTIKFNNVFISNKVGEDVPILNIYLDTKREITNRDRVDLTNWVRLLRTKLTNNNFKYRLYINGDNMKFLRYENK